MSRWDQPHEETDDTIVDLGQHRQAHAQRRVAARRQRLNKVMVTLSVLLITGALILGFLYSPIAKLDQITVVGPSQQDHRERLITSLDHLRGTALFRLDLNAIAHTVKQQPWVDTVELTRKWPSTLQVYVQERACAALILYPGVQQPQFCIDDQGYILPPDQIERGVALPLIRTSLSQDGLVTATPGVFQAYQASTQFPPSITRYVHLWEDSGDQGLVLNMGEMDRKSLKQARIVVGDLVEVKEKAIAIQEMLDQMEREGRVSAVIDVRVPTRPVVTS